MAILGNALTIIYSYWHPLGNILWVPIMWNSLYVVINTTRIMLLLKDSHVFLSGMEQVAFHEHFSTAMARKDFQPLIRGATFVVSTEKHALFTQGMPPTHLILIVDGLAEVDLGPGVTIPCGPQLMGENAFFGRSDDDGASATVYATEGCLYFTWDISSLKLLRKQQPAASRGLELTIGRGLQKKLANTNQTIRSSRSSSVSVSDGTPSSPQSDGEDEEGEDAEEQDGRWTEDYPPAAAGGEITPESNTRVSQIIAAVERRSKQIVAAADRRSKPRDRGGGGELL
eukprot:4575412-Prymnesium_polylepis.1